MSTTDQIQGGIPESAAPIEPGRPGRSRWFLGCAGAAIVALLAVVLGIVGFVTWIRSGGAPLDLGRLVDDETALYAELNVRPEDQAVMELLVRTLNRSTESAREVGKAVPGPFQWAFGGSREGPDLEEIQRTLPVAVIVTRQERLEESVSPALLTVSVPKMANRLRFAAWIASFFIGWAAEGEEDLNIQSYRDHKLYEIDAAEDPFWVSLVGSNLLLSRSDRSLKRAIDRITDPSEEVEGGIPHPLLEGRPGEPLLYVSARGGYSGSVLGLMERGSPEFASVLRPMMEDAGPVTLWANLENPDVLSGEIHVAAGSIEEDEQDEYSGSVTAVLPAGELTMSLQAIPRSLGERHAWRMEVTGLEKAAMGALEILDLDENRPERLPTLTVEPESDGGD